MTLVPDLILATEFPHQPIEGDKSSVIYTLKCIIRDADLTENWDDADGEMRKGLEWEYEQRGLDIPVTSEFPPVDMLGTDAAQERHFHYHLSNIVDDALNTLKES